MSTKFKPRKKESEAVVDDWEASDAEEIEEKGIGQRDVQGDKQLPMGSSTSASRAAHQDVWGDEETNYNRSGRIGAAVPIQDGRSLWQEANRAEPIPQPLLSNRSLPSTVLSPRLYSPASATGDMLQSTEAPPPQILRRDKAGYGKSLGNDTGNEKKKSLREREEEYRKARERIFGTPTPTESPPPQAKVRTPGQGNNSNANGQKKAHASRAKS